METIRVTLETLYDILRNEKKREDLQKLEDTFLIDVVGYLKEKNELLQKSATDDNIFAAGKKDKVEYELRSIQRILKEIYERREKKIIDIALNKSRTGSDLIDTSAMLREEKIFYEQVLTTLDHFRKGIIEQLFKGQLPSLLSEQRISVEPEKKPFADFTAGKPENSKEELSTDSDLTKIKFLHPVPSFIWKDLKQYGPFDEGEETTIFPEVADLLVRKGRAQKI